MSVDHKNKDKTEQNSLFTILVLFLVQIIIDKYLDIFH